MTESEKKNIRGKEMMLAMFIAFFIGAFVSAGMYLYTSKNPTVTTIEKVNTQVVFDLNDSYSEQKVRDYLKELNVRYINVAIAQMKLESGNGSSDVFKHGNNLFGMKQAKARPTTALGTRNNHAYYSHWRQSCIDYALFQTFVMNPENMLSEREWLDYIGRVYATDNTYRNKLTTIIDTLKK